jgi:hypothetical protein
MPDAARLKSLEGELRGEDGVIYALAERDGDGIRVSYGIGAGTLLTLEVELSLPEDGVCEALSWRTRAKEPVLVEESLPVWQGGRE